MINVSLLFIFVAAVSFLGFIINAFFDKLRVTNILPLMLIGLIVGPVLNLVNTGSGSIIASFASVVGALAVAFILFEVGLNISIFKLNKIIKKATKFTFLVAIMVGLTLALIVYFVLNWSIIASLIFGFALSGPSSIIVPTLMKLTDAPEEIKTSLLYEGVVTDAMQLIIPLLLFGFLTGTGVTLQSAAYAVLEIIFGSIILGVFLALAWLYILNRFRRYLKEYRWMLTITMVIATYGISQQLNLSGALTIFLFGMLFSNIGSNALPWTAKKTDDEAGKSIEPLLKNVVENYLYLPEMEYIKNYQREIVFFASTFFFVYIGLLFDLSGINTISIAIGILLTLVILVLRTLFVPTLNEFIPENESRNKVIRRIISFDVARGLSSAIIATVPLSLGIVIPGFLNQIFIVILFTNVASTIGILWAYKK